MSPDTLPCNECGALLQVPTVARYVTCNRCGAQLTVQRTGVTTYTETLRPPPGTNAPGPELREMADRLEQLEHETELARIDREWEMERERYMITSKYGRRYVPSAGASIVTGVVVVGFGVFWMVLMSNVAGNFDGGPLTFFPLFGVVFIIAGIAISIHQYTKAQQYQAAYDAYQRRRAAARDRLRD